MRRILFSHFLHPLQVLLTTLLPCFTSMTGIAPFCAQLCNLALACSGATEQRTLPLPAVAMPPNLPMLFMPLVLRGTMNTPCS